MKKIIINLLAIGAIIASAVNAYLLFFSGGSLSTEASSISSSNNSQTAKSTSQSESTTTVAQSSEQTSTQSTGLKDGTYTGETVTTHHGDYQVQITVSGGSISDVNVLEYPNDNPKSQQINQTALPTYTKEALSSQSSKVSLISGASEAYEGFTGSLQDAINQANV